MTAAGQRPLDHRVEVTDPGGRRFVAAMTLATARAAYPPGQGYTVTPVIGYDHPSGVGFVVVERPDLRKEETA